jgi:3-(3-hydroxy-phenyl)propionate hydroxylase
VIDGYPKLVTFYQPDLERALRSRVAQLPTVTCAAGVELLGFSETNDGVRARLKLSDGSDAEITTRYLIGADGASSMVRGLIGQDFRGRTYAEDWLIVDARNARNPIDHIEFHCKPRGASPHLPAPGDRERWEFMLSPGETAEQMEQNGEIKRLLAQATGR